MNDLEKTLNALDKPKLQVPSFKQDLRHALIEESRRGAADSFYKPAFYGALFTCSALATVLVMLLLNPHVLVPNSPPQEQLLSSQLLNEPMGTPTHQTDESAAESNRHFVSDRSQHLLQAMDPKYDKAYLERLFHTKLRTSPGPIRSTNSEKVMVMREYELANGRRIWVYTEVPPETEPVPEKTSDFTTL